MPTRPWKKAIVADGLLSGFRSKGSGSLVVQTGFPTSLADLIVKNHGRLKKASRTSKKKPSPAPDLYTTGCGGAATRFPALGCHLRDTEIEKFACTGRGAEPGPRFRLLAGTLIILAALLIGKKKLVLWITVSAFSLLLLEFCGRFLKPCLEARKKLDSVIGSFDLIGSESSSPIKQTSLGCLAGSPVSDIKPEESRIPDQSSELFEEDCRKGKSKSSGRCDAKKLLMRKFMLNKTHGIREDGRIPHCVEATEEELSEKSSLVKGEEVDDAEDDDDPNFKTSYGDLGDGDGNKLHKCFQSVLFLIVLCGLMRGKSVALGLALAWCFLFRFIRVMREGKMT